MRRQRLITFLLKNDKLIIFKQKNEDPADKSGSDDESDQDEEDDSSSSEEEPKKKKKKEEESSSSEEEEKKKDDDSSSSEEEKPAKKPASKPAVPAKKPAKDEESSEEKPAKKPVPAAFAKKPTPAPVKKPTKDEDSSSEEEKKPAPKKPASKPATPAKKPAKDEESSEEKPKKAAPSPAPKKGEKRPLETTTDTATQAANKKPRVDPKPAAPEATPAVKEEANFKQYGSALTPNNVRPRVLNVFKSDLVLASDAKIDLTLSEWIIVWAARAAKHTQPSIFLNQLTNIKLNPAYNLPVDADTALYQLLASPEKWEAFRQLMDVFKHKQLAHLSDLIQKLVPALAAQYEDVTPPVAAPAPVEKKKGSAVASVLAQKAKK